MKYQPFNIHLNPVPGNARGQTESINIAAHPDASGMDRSTWVNVALKIIFIFSFQNKFFLD
jgi:hypothetical protein